MAGSLKATAHEMHVNMCESDMVVRSMSVSVCGSVGERWWWWVVVVNVDLNCGPAC
jgi:hypothetical protein